MYIVYNSEHKKCISRKYDYQHTAVWQLIDKIYHIMTISV